MESGELIRKRQLLAYPAVEPPSCVRFQLAGAVGHDALEKDYIGDSRESEASVGSGNLAEYQHNQQKTLCVEAATGKHCNSINVMKMPITFPFETCPKVGDKNLCSFVKSDRLAFEESFVSEAWKMLYDQVD